jgi:hypothetical protein
MIYETKTVTITNQDLENWYKIFEKKNVTLEGPSLIPGLCLWSYAHQENDRWVAANINIRFSKPIYTGETFVISGEIIKETICYCNRILTITVNNEVRQKAELKCMPLN